MMLSKVVPPPTVASNHGLMMEGRVVTEDSFAVLLTGTHHTTSPKTCRHPGNIYYSNHTDANAPPPCCAPSSKGVRVWPPGGGGGVCVTGLQFKQAVDCFALRTSN